MHQKLQKFLLGLGFMCTLTAVVGQPYDPRHKKSKQATPQSAMSKAGVKQFSDHFSQRGLRFTENKGQVTDLDGKPRPDVLFTAQNGGVKLFLTAKGIHYQFKREFVKQQVAEGNLKLPEGKTMKEIEKTEFYRLDLGLKGANPNPVVQTEGAGQDVENFFLSHAPQGIEGVRNFSKIIYKEVYPHIDWVVYTKNGRLEYDFVVHPGGKVSDIQLGYDSEQSLALQPNGGLLVTTPLGSISENKPFSYQEAGKEISSRFVVNKDGFGFDVPEYNKNETLTIDPVVEWATYYGGIGLDEGNSVVTDALGNVFLAGVTSSSSGMASGDGHQTTYGGNVDAFLVKFNSAGVRQWSTYYGGNGRDEGLSVATDGLGNVFLGGWTLSTNSIASGGHQNTLGSGSYDAFLVKFNTEGTMQWGTYYGASIPLSYAEGHSVATDVSGNVYLAGYTNSTNGIAFGGHQNTIGGGEDAFLVKFNAAGVRQWATYYGGLSSDVGKSVATDFSGNVLLAGYTSSENGIAIGGHQNTFSGPNSDAFLVKFNSSGVRLWGTYYGGTGGNSLDDGYSVASDGSGNVFLAGTTSSTNDIASGGNQNSLAGFLDAFLVKFSMAGVRLWSTYHGGINQDRGRSIATDASGNVFLAGWSNSESGIASGGHQNSLVNNSDAFLVKFSDEVILLPTISSFTPTSGNIGTTVTITGDNFTGASEVSFNNVNAVSFTVNSATSITTTVPGGATTGKIKVTTDEGTATSATDFVVTYTLQTWYRDDDRDGFGRNVGTRQSITRPNGFVAVGGDCNDYDPTIYPGAPELADGKDNNCNGEVDEGLECRRTWYRDADGDGFGRSNLTKQSCIQPSGYVDNANDCNDGDATVYPGAPELPDGKDNNCNGEVDEGLECARLWYGDVDGDGFGRPNLPRQSCIQPVGYVDNANDCNDSDPTIFPGAPELPDGKDNNCNGQVDEGLECTRIWYRDVDGDGFGRPNLTKQSCIQPAGYVDNPNDCNDGDPTIYPGAPEICDGKVNDCNGTEDGGCDMVFSVMGAKPDGSIKPKAKVSATEFQVRLWPNPATTVVMLSLDGFEPNKKVEILMLTAAGRTVQMLSLVPQAKGQQVQFDIRGMAAGYYLFQVKQGKLTETKKFMIFK